MRRGRYQDGVPYQAGQKIQPSGDGSVTHILEAFGVSAGGETINFKRVTDEALRKMESGAAIGENVVEVAGDGESEYNEQSDVHDFDSSTDESKYSQRINWGILDIDVRPVGRGFFGRRVKQSHPRVDAYELKINPNNESYYLRHPDGSYAQFENMVNDVVLDGKLIIKQKSFYHVNDLPEFAKNGVLKEAARQVEAADFAGYTVEWLVSDPKAVTQLMNLFYEKNVRIIVTYFPE